MQCINFQTFFNRFLWGCLLLLSQHSGCSICFTHLQVTKRGYFESWEKRIKLFYWTSIDVERDVLEPTRVQVVGASKRISTSSFRRVCVCLASWSNISVARNCSSQSCCQLAKHAVSGQLSCEYTLFLL